jgi:hypothetical protein
MLVTKPLDLSQLTQELQAAGVSIRGLGQTGDQLHTYDVQGNPVDLPASAQATVSAHTPRAGADFGGDVPDDYSDRLASVVSQLRAYLATAAPSPAQTVTVVKLLIGAMLYLLRRQAR